MTDGTLSLKDRAILLSLLTVIFFLTMLMRVVLAPLLPVIEKELGFTHAISGSLFMMIAIGYAMGLIVSGFLSAHLTHRLTIAAAAFAGGSALFVIAVSNSLWIILIGLVFLGVATGLYLPSGMTTITSAFTPENWGKAIAVHEFAPSLGFISAPFIVEGLLLLCSWQTILILIGAVSFLVGIVFLCTASGGNIKGQAPTIANIRPLLAKPAFWIMAVLFTLALGASIGIYSMMPLYLVAERGIDRGTANTLVGLSRVPLLAVSLIAGWMSDRFGPKATITMVIIFIGFMTILLGLLPGRWTLLMVFLQPMLTVCYFPAGFTILSRIVPPHTRNLSISLTIFIAYLFGAGCFPTFMGLFGDAGLFSMAIVIIGILMILSVFLLARLDLSTPRDGATIQ